MTDETDRNGTSDGTSSASWEPKRGRLWLNDGSCIRLRPSWPNHVWAYDFVMARTKALSEENLLSCRGADPSVGG